MTQPKVAVCIATYRRPEGLGRLLTSLASQRFSGPAPEWRIVVVDNDAQGSARPVCEAYRTGALTGGHPPVPLTYVGESRQGLSYARNAAISAALYEDALCFIDDDETASETWLDSLVRSQAGSGAEAVCGAVTYILPKEAPSWIRRGGFFKPLPLMTDGVEALGRGSHNLLLSCAFLRRSGLRFDLRFNRAGGEDEFFFRTGIARFGLRIAAAPDARVEETVLPGRTTLGWLLRRNFRYGNTLARCEVLLDPQIGRLTLRAMKGCVRVLLGAGLALVGSITFSPARAARGLTMAAFGSGMLAGLAGYTHESYTPQVMMMEAR